MNVNKKKKLVSIIVSRGLKYTIFVYAFGFVALTSILYFVLSSDMSKVNKSFFNQTYHNVLPDLQDGNHYSIKRNLDQMVKSGRFKGAAVVGYRGDVIAQSGALNGSLQKLKSYKLPPSRILHINDGTEKIVAKGIFDQNGVIWGTLVANVNVDAFMRLVRYVTILFVIIMALVAALYSILNTVTITRSAKALTNFADELHNMSIRIDESDATTLGGGSIDEVTKRHMVLESRNSNIFEIDEILDAFKRLLKKTHQYMDACTESKRLAAIGNISYHLAHDMRSPLSVLKTLIEEVREGNVSRDDELLEASLRSVDKLNSMAEDLLDYSKALKTTKSIFLIDNIVRDILSEVAAEATQRNMTVTYESKGDLRVEIDGAKISRVLANIIINAIQAHDKPGSIQVGVEMKTCDISISVTDTGRGIPPDKMSKIFEKSFTFGKPKGTGLGLAYCKQAVEAHGGRIEVQSEVGRGSKFTIYLPGCVVDEKNFSLKGAGTSSNKSLLNNKASGGWAGNVLIADDDFGIRLQWISIVKALGGEVVLAATTPDEIFNDGNFDYSKINTAIVDYQFTGHAKTGIDLIAYLKKKGVERIHLCTGFYNVDSIREEARRAGAISIIAKPIDISAAKSALL